MKKLMTLLTVGGILSAILPLAAVADDIPWTTEADGSWRSGAIDDGQCSSTNMFVQGPVAVSFRWKTSSESGCDVLAFEVDGSEINSVSGVMDDWKRVTCAIPDAGEHVLSWIYRKDGSVSDGDDCGWVRDFSSGQFVEATITFDATGGAVDESSRAACKDFAIGALPTPTRAGLTFSGWFTAATGGDEVTADTVVTGNMTLYAHWEEIVYTYGYIDNGDGTVTLSPSYDEYGNWVGAISPLPVGEFTVPDEIDGMQVVAIDDDVFDACYEMTSVVIPACVTNISQFAFDESGLTNFTVNASNLAYKSIDGVLYTKDGKVLVTWPPMKVGDIAVAPGTERITRGAFSNHHGITSISFPDGLTTIEDYAFRYCQNENLISVEIPANVERIGAYAFGFCPNLTSVMFAGTVDNIDIADTAFVGTPYDAAKSFELIVNEYGTLVGFHGVALEALVISNHLGGTVLTGVGDYALSSRQYYASSMTNVVVPEGVTWVGSYAFVDDTALESVTLPESLTRIDYGAFENCTALRTIRIPAGVLSIGEPFLGCTNLTVYAPTNLYDTFSVPEENGCTIEYYEVPLHTVIFDANGGAIDGEATTAWTVYEGRRLDSADEYYDYYDLPMPTRSGYEFIGWFTAATGGDEVTADTVVTGNMTVYARWRTMYTVTFDANGGYTWYSDEWGENWWKEYIWTRTVADGECLGDSLWAPNIDSVAYFMGWFDEVGNEFSSNTVVTNDMTVTARWIVDDGTFQLVVIDGVLVKCFGECPATLSADDFPAGVTSIGYEAFYDKETLTEVELPATVTNIEAYAFADCYELAQVTLNNGLEAIGDYAFAWCYSLTNVVIPASVNSIGYYAFGSSGLETVAFDGGKGNIANLNDYAFRDTPYELNLPFEMIVGDDGVVTGFHGTCPDVLTAQDWPNDVTGVANAFSGVYGLTSVVIPEGVTTLGEYAFYRCSSLTNVVIPASMEVISESAFDRTPWGDENIPFSLDVSEYGELRGWHGRCPADLTIPADVMNINGYAFQGCANLESLTVPTNSVDMILGYGAFSDCPNLRYAYLPRAWEGTFEEYSIFWGSPVTVYYYEGEEPTFVTVTLNANGGSLEGTTISVVPDNAIGMLPEPVRSGYAFLGWFTAATDGTEVTAETVVTGNMTVYAQWEEIVYTYSYIDNGDGTVTLSCYDENGNWVGGISPLPVGEFTVPSEIDGKQVVAIGDSYFDNCYQMTSIVIPASVTNISVHVCINVANITNVTVAAANSAYKSVDGILYAKDGKTLVACPRAKGGAIAIAAGTENVGPYAFYGNCYLTSISIPSGVKVIDDYAFDYCQNENFTSVTIPAGVEMIGYNAFGYCSYLADVTFSGDEAQIGIAVTAFAGTPYDAAKPFALIVDVYGNLIGFHGVAPEALVISNHLDGTVLAGIGDSALSSWQYDTSSMTNVVVPEGVTWVGSYAFAGDTALENLTLPESLTSIGYGAFGNCTALRTIRIPAAVAYIDNPFLGCTNLTVYAPTNLCNMFSVPETCTIEYYEVPLHTVTFDANGGTVDGEATTAWTVYEGRRLDSADEYYDYYDLPTPARSGYDFIGWFTAATGGTEVTADTVLTADMTLYAHWEEITPEWYFDIEDGNATITGNSVSLVGNVEIPASVTAEEEDEYGNVTEVSYPVTTIGDCAFDGMDGITSVTIPASVTNIQDGAFEDCYGLTNVVFAGNMAGVKMRAVCAFAGTPWLDTYRSFLPEPDNDDFAGAEAISGVSGSVEGTTLNSSRETNDLIPDEYDDTYPATVWYRWVAPTNGTFVFSVADADPYYDWSCAIGATTGYDAENACWGDVSVDWGTLTIDATIGDEYWIEVGSYREDGYSEEFAFTLSWDMYAPPSEVVVDAGANTVTPNGNGYTITPPAGGELTAEDVGAVMVKTLVSGEWVYTTAGYDITFAGGIITVSLKKPEVDGMVDSGLKDTADKSGFLVDPDKVTLATVPDLQDGETLGALPVESVPGLWYQASWGASLRDMTAGGKVQATGTKLYLGVVRQTGTAGFYKVSVSETSD